MGILDMIRIAVTKIKAYIDNKLSQKVDKVQGKGLSSNDYTDEEKAKLQALENYDDTTLKNTKVGYSEVVDNQLLMYSDSTKSHLLATLDLPSGGGAVNDVKINNASIVDENGEANIPYASASSTNDAFGLTAIFNGYGLTLNSNRIILTQATEQSITNRNSRSFDALNLCNLDYAVKQALTDGKGAPYTSAEKKSAQERLGIVTLTQEEYDLLEVKDESTVYVIVDEVI